MYKCYTDVGLYLNPIVFNQKINSLFRNQQLCFRVLGDSTGMLEQSVEESMKTIKAAIILNNRAIREGIPAPNHGPVQPLPPVAEAVYRDHPDGLTKRSRLIEHYFN